MPLDEYVAGMSSVRHTLTLINLPVPFPLLEVASAVLLAGHDAFEEVNLILKGTPEEPVPQLHVGIAAVHPPVVVQKTCS